MAKRLLMSLLILLAVAARAYAEQGTPYVVDGLALGDSVSFGSKAYRAYECNPSEVFSGFTWCQRKRHEGRGKRRIYTSNSILHDSRGTALYISRSIVPAFLNERDAQKEIIRLSGKFGEKASVLRMPSRTNLPTAIIASWGKVTLLEIDEADQAILAAGKSPRIGLLIDYLGDFQKSAKAGLPIYRLAGGAGYVWRVSFDKKGKGNLRFLTVNASALSSPKRTSTVAANTEHVHPVGSSGHVWAREGWWNVKWYPDTPGCSASAEFDRGTYVNIRVAKAGAMLFFVNKSWSFIRKGNEYRARVVFGRNDQWTGNFTGITGGGKFGLYTDVSLDFLEAFAARHGLRLYVTGRRKSLTNISLKGTRAALNAAIDCMIQRQRAPTTEAKHKESDEDSVGGSGTGIIVSSAGHILTNNHVVKSCSKIHVTQVGDIPRSANVLRTDRTNDLAVLKLVDGEVTGTVASFRGLSRVKAGETIAVYGFPLTGALSKSGNIVSGNITSLSGLGDDVRFFQISAPVQPGNSGGPLIDQSGLVIGVVTSRIDDFAVAGATGAIPQNVNFAIKANVAKSFLNVHSVDYQIVQSGKPKPLTDIVDEARQFTVLITCD